MSLINEALKKAQRSRHDGQPADAPPVPGGSPIVKRSQPRSAKTVALIGGGAFALVLVSVVTTLFLLKSRSAAPTAPASTATSATPAKTPTASTSGETPARPASPATSPADPAASPAPAAKADQPAAPSDRAAPTTATASSAKAGTAAPAGTQPPTASAAHSQPTPPPAAATVSSPAASAVAAPTPVQPAAPAPAATPQRDERIATFVDAVRVTGIRSAGNDSRVLMNGQFFRVNDIVERTLGVRLVKVEVDSLTFADANGLTYVKYF